MINSDCGQDIGKLFSKIVLWGVHKPEHSEQCPEITAEHYHIIGEPRFSTRYLRDISLERLQTATGLTSLTVKDAFIGARCKYIVDEQHYNNTIAYVKKRCAIILEDNSNSLTYSNKCTLFSMIDEIQQPSGTNTQELEEFLKRYPIPYQWVPEAQNYAYPKTITTQLQKLENARTAQILEAAPTQEQITWAKQYRGFLILCQELRQTIESMPKNTGCALILCGQSDTLKSTIARILAISYGKYSVWPGSQFIQRDMLKYDTAARQGVQTLVIEEMQWYDHAKKITIENTILHIKEQLTGSGLDIRTSKSGQNQLTGQLKFQLKRLIISMNPDQWCNFRVLHQLIKSKNEYSKRLIIIDMDTEHTRIQKILKESNLADWQEDSRVETERVLGKILGNDNAFDQTMRNDMPENQLKHLMDEELEEIIDENNEIVYRKRNKK